MAIIFFQLGNSRGRERSARERERKKQRRPGSLGFWKDITLALASKEKRERDRVSSLKSVKKKAGKRRGLVSCFSYSE
jgi:hypothetical protein